MKVKCEYIQSAKTWKMTLVIKCHEQNTENIHIDLYGKVIVREKAHSLRDCLKISLLILSEYK